MIAATLSAFCAFALGLFSLRFSLFHAFLSLTSYRLTVTALSTAVVSVQCGYGNTAPLQLELNPTITEQENAVELIGAVIKIHFDMGGTLINVNIVDKDVLLEAHRDPTTHPDLVVRVTGFTAYFATLSPEFRQLVIDRVVSDR